VGVLLYAIHNLLQDKEINLGVRIGLKDVFISTSYVLPGALIVVAVLIFWPDLAM